MSVHDFVREDDVYSLIVYLREGVNPNLLDKDGNSLLHICFLYQNFNFIPLLLERGANPLIKNRLYK
tara:strand:+ start:82 stop:282 length:201 start_codon:yes stop_codon:yes gene_type:complete